MDDIFKLIDQFVVNEKLPKRLFYCVWHGQGQRKSYGNITPREFTAYIYITIGKRRNNRGLSFHQLFQLLTNLRMYGSSNFQVFVAKRTFEILVPMKTIDCDCNKFATFSQFI